MSARSKRRRRLRRSKLRVYDAASITLTVGGVEINMGEIAFGNRVVISPRDVPQFTTHEQLDEAFGKGSLGR